MSRPAIMHKMKNVITRYDNTILLQFVMPTKDPGIFLILLKQCMMKKMYFTLGCMLYLSVYYIKKYIFNTFNVIHLVNIESMQRK